MHCNLCFHSKSPQEPQMSPDDPTWAQMIPRWRQMIPDDPRWRWYLMFPDEMISDDTRHRWSQMILACPSYSGSYTWVFDFWQAWASNKQVFWSVGIQDWANRTLVSICTLRAFEKWHGLGKYIGRLRHYQNLQKRLQIKKIITVQTWWRLQYFVDGSVCFPMIPYDLNNERPTCPKADPCR